MQETAHNYATALYELSKDKTEQQKDDLIKSLLSTLKEKKILFYLPTILKKFEDLVNEEKQKNTIRVSTPHKLTSEQKEDIKEQFGSGEYIFEEDKKSIAGLVIQKNDKLLYSTLSKATIQLENKLTK